MIRKDEILERAREWQLRPEVVEKDYVLGWLLAAVAADEEAGSRWVLKGGTCVKKCFFETYRFSEDLDFTLVPEAGYDEEAIRETLNRLATRTGEISGIGFSPEHILLKKRVDKQGRRTYEGRIGYQGPLAVPGWPRILFDLTQHEVVVEEPVFRAILHPYTDALPPDALVQTYAFEELLAEKTRALMERARPRDLYDVVYISNNAPADMDLRRIRVILVKKCEAKGLVAPTKAALTELVRASAEIRGDWDAMLAHQLPQCPTIDSFLTELSAALSWLDEVVVGHPLPMIIASAKEQILRPATPGISGHRTPLEVIRFAGANRVLVEFDYSGTHRLVEPYSLRRAGTGNVLLYAWERASGQIKAFNVDKIFGLRATAQIFTPRYAIELSSSAGMTTSIPLSTGRARFTAPRRRVARVRTGPTYIFRCPTCGKEFRRSKNDTTLRRHTFASQSYQCPSRRGYLVRVT